MTDYALRGVFGNIIFPIRYHRYYSVSFQIQKGGGQLVFGELNSKRTFKHIREILLVCLSSGQKTTNQIASRTRINWRSVERHLTWLVGMGLVKEIFSSKFVRVFELSDQGMEYVKLLGIDPVINGKGHLIGRRMVKL